MGTTPLKLKLYGYRLMPPMPVTWHIFCNLSKKTMDRDKIHYNRGLDRFSIEKIKAELSMLDREMVSADGVQLRPSQCYHFETKPLHVLFNTNCPDELKQKVEEIITRHIADL